MPRKNDPGQIRVGSGQRPPGKDNLHLDPIAGVPATGGEVVPAEVKVDQIGDGSEPLRAHIHDPKAAHHATAIEINQPSPYYPYFSAQDVQGALDELGGLVPPIIPGVGLELEYLPISGIPDWGELKLSEAPLTYREPTSFYVTENDPTDIYPYYWFAPDPANDTPFDPENWGGNDPETDLTFNVTDGVYTGGGRGFTFSGGWTPDVGSPNPVKQTMRIMELTDTDRYIVVSGVVCPADRGVLALIYWPPGGTIGDFLALPLEERVLAAILLGEGLEINGNDGYPGKLFHKGETSGNYDPFAFPGQATGQYNLVEIHSGILWNGGALPIPMDDTAGVVRLGYDPAAGEPVVPGGGLPILGATTAAFNGGNDNNFFAYRLPYFSDYTEATGIRYTPEDERDRYFQLPAVSINPGGTITQAGNYPNLEEDYWAFQLARYRHRFRLADNVASTSIREQGSYMLLHFKREFYFENLVRDGVVPLDEHLYSANLVNWTDPENLDNITTLATGDPAARSYHILRAAVTEDVDGVATPLVTAATWNYSRVADMVVYVSGVAYFLPMQFTGPNVGDPSFQISDLVLGITNFFKNTYRITRDPTFRMYHMNPLLLSVAPFTYEANAVTPPGLLTSPADQILTQRIEFVMEDLGAYSMADGPLPVDGATVILPPATTIDFEGDEFDPAFTQSGKLRMFMRRPAAHDDADDAEMPTSGTLVSVFDSKSILFHSVRYTDIFSPPYGNFLDGGGQSLATLETEEKDTTERFLDEVYRYHSKWVTVPDPDPKSQLVGPGLPLGPVPIVDLPVRTNLAFGGPFESASWMLGQHFPNSLLAVAPFNLTTEAQVCGLPERNPHIKDGVVGPFPSAGICMYPQKNYSVNYRPGSAEGDITSGPQPDYTAANGIREYVRAFDVAFSRSATPDPYITGQPYFTLRVRGLRLEDFEYTGGGTPGGDLAILVKVPGLTTWMDAGREDGTGPSKQDPAFDGAGCAIKNNRATFNDYDRASGVVFSETRIYVGPSIDLFTNIFGEVPVLVMVRFYDSLPTKAFNFEQGGATGTVANVRGLIGLEIVRTA